MPKQCATSVIQLVRIRIERENPLKIRPKDFVRHAEDFMQRAGDAHEFRVPPGVAHPMDEPVLRFVEHPLVMSRLEQEQGAIDIRARLRFLHGM